MAIYVQAGLSIASATDADKKTVQALQADLRKLGYLHSGVDGVYGNGTKAAVRAFQYDLLNNKGRSRGGDGEAPVAVTSFNVGANGALLVKQVDGVFDQAVAQCLVRMMADEQVPKLPFSTDPVSANQAAMDAVLSKGSTVCPSLFLAAIVKQESGGKHYVEPHGADIDNVITVGLDRNGDSSDAITSRGYGLGQYTIFHHPPRPEEISDFMLDSVKNVEKARKEFREKLDKFVVGPADHADDRLSDVGYGPLRVCKYGTTDSRYMSDCANCVKNAPRVDINATTTWYAGTSQTYQPTVYHPETAYAGVPQRSAIGCDWPYAVRRYNGSGINSFHYQAQVLLILAHMSDHVLSKDAQKT